MTSIEALVLPARSRDLTNVTLGGLGLPERAALALHRGGIDRVHVSAGCAIGGKAIERLARRGVDVSIAGEAPLSAVLAGRGLLLVTADVIFEPSAVRALVEKLRARGWEAASAMEAAPATFALLTPPAVDALRAASEPHVIDALGALRVCSVAPVFCRPVSSRRHARPVERAYITHRNGLEAVFTRAIRRFSVPLTSVLLRVRLTANQVTLLGFALALLSAWFFSRRAYLPGIAGALAYYASMIFDCSDGEVARTTLSDSHFGAWLETATDYLSYFVVMGGLVWGEWRAHPVCGHIPAAQIAATASLAIVAVVWYLRGRVAGENPGAFDDALAEEFRRGTAIQRFAAWGRQLIKRAFFAHLILFQAVIGHLPALLYIWVYGALGALAVLLVVQSGIARRVKVLPARVPAALGIVED